MPTDNFFIYGIPSNYTFELGTNHDLAKEYELVITFPSDFYVRENYACKIGCGDNINYVCSTAYNCRADNRTNSITMSEWTTYDIMRGSLVNFTVDSIVNAGNFGY